MYPKTLYQSSGELWCPFSALIKNYVLQQQQVTKCQKTKIQQKEYSLTFKATSCFMWRTTLRGNWATSTGKRKFQGTTLLIVSHHTLKTKLTMEDRVEARFPEASRIRDKTRQSRHGSSSTSCATTTSQTPKEGHPHPTC